MFIPQVSSRRKWLSTSRSIIDARFHRLLYQRRHCGHDIEAGGAFNGVDAGAVSAPRCADAVVVGGIDGDDAGAGGNTSGIVGAGGQDDNDFPAAGGDGDAAVVESGNVAVGTGSSPAVAAADNVDFVAGVEEGAAVVFQVGPRLLVVAQGLRHHVGHEERGRVVGYRAGAVGAGAVMAAVEAGTGVAGGLHLIPARGQGSIGTEVILAGGAAAPVGAQVPAYPIGDAAVAVVAQGVLGLAEQVIGRLGGVSSGAAGVAKGEVLGKVLSGGAWGGFFLLAGG